MVELPPDRLRPLEMVERDPDRLRPLEMVERDPGARARELCVREMPATSA